ncbi:uncharacterized protein VP01_5094g1 [Puccinia sorghi]|uniref:Uncharacterized protein n=1 Tax=Puccinia sorghi TaxID=27349 RepID=A0A0L6ULB6_9BASI|nr:uncharacterized protein VP01_5094g1 [Puccinia sorghi]
MVPVPHLRKLITLVNHPNIKTPGVWDTINQDLEARRKQPPLYHFAFSQLILEGDQHIWDGKKNDMAKADQAIPTKEEVQEQVLLQQHPARFGAYIGKVVAAGLSSCCR